MSDKGTEGESLDTVYADITDALRAQDVPHLLAIIANLLALNTQLLLRVQARIAPEGP